MQYNLSIEHNISSDPEDLDNYNDGHSTLLCRHHEDSDTATDDPVRAEQGTCCHLVRCGDTGGHPVINCLKNTIMQ